MAQEVLFYHSGMTGAPSATVNVLGGLIAVLDACLVNGFNAVGISSMTRSGSVVAVTTASSHGYVTGEVKEISGADQADYNGRWGITVTGANSFTFTITTTPVTPATGTLNVKNPAAGWTKPIAGANTAVYRSKVPGSNGHYMQIEDNNPYADANVSARVRMVVAATALDAGDQLGEQIRIQKANTSWVLVADSRTCYVVMGATNSFMFGEYESYRAADGYNFFVNRGENASANVGGTVPGRVFPSVLAEGNAYAQTSHSVSHLRSYSQMGGSVTGSPVHPQLSSQATSPLTAAASGWQGTSQVTPNPVDASVVCASVPVTEIANVGNLNVFHLRGVFRGMYLPQGRLSPAGFGSNNFQRLDDVVIGGVVRSVVVFQHGLASAAQVAFDLAETW